MVILEDLHILLICRHIYKTFYHKSSRDSMRIFTNKIPESQYTIWNKLHHEATVEENVHNEDFSAEVY